MNATQTRTGGVRKSLGRRIEEWLGGRAKPARGRARTRAALAVEGLEGRVVLSSVPQLGSIVNQAIASNIVQVSVLLTYQHPQSLPTVVNALESSQVLSRAEPGGCWETSAFSFWEDVNKVNWDVEYDLGTIKAGPFASGGVNSPVSIAGLDSMDNGSAALGSATTLPGAQLPGSEAARRPPTPPTLTSGSRSRGRRFRTPGEGPRQAVRTPTSRARTERSLRIPISIREPQFQPPTLMAESRSGKVVGALAGAAGRSQGQPLATPDAPDPISTSGRLGRWIRMASRLRLETSPGRGGLGDTPEPITVELSA